MDPRSRYLETMLFKSPDKIPLYPGGPRESTLKAWKSQGMPENAFYLDTVLDIIGVPKSAALKFSTMDITTKMIPEFEVKILDHRDGHYLISDWMGAITEISDEFDETYLRSAKDFVTRKWHKFPVETKEDWAEMKKRYDPDEGSRISKDLKNSVRRNIESGHVISMFFNGVFWQLREWCGFENLCIMMIEQPDFVMEMADYWGDYVLNIIKKALKHAVPDRVLISEDMAYKAHSMISPAMTREFIIPQYNKWVPVLKNAGCKVFEVDSDGCIEVLIPLWIESGINCCSPIEVAAYNDILKFRNIFGENMAYMQGMDKRLMAKGGKELEDHIMGIVPKMFEKGGFIPGCDHGVPPDISWQNYVEFTRLLAKLSGWI